MRAPFNKTSGHVVLGSLLVAVLASCSSPQESAKKREEALDSSPLSPSSGTVAAPAPAVMPEKVVVTSARREKKASVARDIRGSRKTTERVRVDGIELMDNSVTSADIRADSDGGEYSREDIANDAINRIDIIDATITVDDLGDKTIGSNEIIESPMTLGYSATTVANAVADGAALSVDLLDNSIASADITDNSVAGAEIVDGPVASADIIDGDVVTFSSITASGTAVATAGNGLSIRGGRPLENMLKPIKDLPSPGTISDSVNVREVVEEPVRPTRYRPVVENNFLAPSSSPLSTFSIDVDAASYSNTRRHINGGELPPVDAVRIEEMVNYFTYDYPAPKGTDPFAIITETADCPWNSDHRLVHVGLQGRVMDPAEAPASNLVFLIDVSGSMDPEECLPLLKKSFKLLVDNLREKDRVSIVAYAGAARVVLPPTSGIKKEKIMAAIESLDAGGSTAGGDGIELAYRMARENFRPGGNNRVVLATDGDFNIGTSDYDGLVSIIEAKRKEGIFLSVLGVGTEHYQDANMEGLADNGNGNFFFLDNIEEARKVLATELTGTLYAIAKDVKIQVEFNPKMVAAYRLIGYENRALAARDFDDDGKDAGELGAGHSVTALYEIIPTGAEVKYDIEKPKDPSKHRLESMRPAAYGEGDLMEVRLRYKHPADSVSNLMGAVVKNEKRSVEKASENFRFSAAVAELGLLLRNSSYAGTASYDDVIRLASGAAGSDAEGYRKEFVTLATDARRIAGAGETLGAVR